MNCFNHPDIPANGICTICNKGLCRACIAEGMNFVCCRGSCQAKGQSLAARKNELTRKADEATRALNRIPIWTIYFRLLGVFLFLAAVMLGDKNASLASVFGIVGIGLLLAGLVGSLFKKKAGASPDAATNTPPPVPPIPPTGAGPATPAPR